MNFKEYLIAAKAGDEDATVYILKLYEPLLLKQSVVAGVLDEDLLQELRITLWKCIIKFSL